jgi:tryptophanyl-tRNA synthetase
MPVETILSGMRPTGKLHLGNYFGALVNWVALQEKYRCYFMIADWHALTSEYENTASIEPNVWDMLIDWLASGLDPEKCVIFRQSWVPAHAELHLILSMITPLSWLERVPTYKEQMQEVNNRDLSNYGFLGYPLLQSADILLYRANKVPVGEDQLAHLELTREVTRRFNHFYGPVLTEPQALLSRAPRVPGTDGRKMSKSYNNAILLSDSAADVTAKIKTMYTDPKKIRANDPGNPDGCVVFATHKLYTPEKETQEINANCRSGALGCVACKKRLSETLNAGLEPIRAKRADWVGRTDQIHEIVEEGSRKANVVAQETLSIIRQAIKLADVPALSAAAEKRRS